MDRHYTRRSGGVRLDHHNACTIERHFVIAPVGLELAKSACNQCLERHCVGVSSDLRCPSRMKDILLIVVHLAVMVATLCRPGGVRPFERRLGAEHPLQ